LAVAGHGGVRQRAEHQAGRECHAAQEQAANAGSGQWSQEEPWRSQHTRSEDATHGPKTAGHPRAEPGAEEAAQRRHAHQEAVLPLGEVQRAQVEHGRDRGGHRTRTGEQHPTRQDRTQRGVVPDERETRHQFGAPRGSHVAGRRQRLGLPQRPDHHRIDDERGGVHEHGPGRAEERDDENNEKNGAD